MIASAGSVAAHFNRIEFVEENYDNVTAESYFRGRINVKDSDVFAALVRRVQEQRLYRPDIFFDARSDVAKAVYKYFFERNRMVDRGWSTFKWGSLGVVASLFTLNPLAIGAAVVAAGGAMSKAAGDAKATAALPLASITDFLLEKASYKIDANTDIDLSLRPFHLTKIFAPKNDELMRDIRPSHLKPLYGMDDVFDLTEEKRKAFQ